MIPLASALRRHPKALAAAVAASAILLVLGLLLAYARGGGTLPAPLRFLHSERLASGSAEEVALRTLRLAGYDHAIVGEQDGIAVVRLAVPSVASPADVELSWQTALSVAAEAYPRAGTCIAQVFSGEQALIEVRIKAEDLRAARTAAGIRAAAEMVYLSESGGDG